MNEDAIALAHAMLLGLYRSGAITMTQLEQMAFWQKEEAGDAGREVVTRVMASLGIEDQTEATDD